ncbi:hypothetical protein BJV78DRAFT_467302 [Lactifluus subvellereus]|nr:hypothetical protein BJV78DRAFT_467302 [Lactifluus subvellereus]
MQGLESFGLIADGERAALLRCVTCCICQDVVQLTIHKSRPGDAYGAGDPLLEFTESIIRSCRKRSGRTSVHRHGPGYPRDDSESHQLSLCSIILFGRLGPILGHNIRRKVLGSACAKVLKDNFPPARVATLMACIACTNLFEVEELAGKVVVVARALVGKEKTVRDPGFKAVTMFVQVLEEHAAKMVDPTSSPIPLIRHG